ncbi:hypothetical protein B0H14DRAFT_2648719 [Mycena olivaceomarginata]|nr:hypothetical protein B0H14DRAFT_2648719 [Mycena olivaceomarginata]
MRFSLGLGVLTIDTRREPSDVEIEPEEDENDGEASLLRHYDVAGANAHEILESRKTGEQAASELSKPRLKYSGFAPSGVKRRRGADILGTFCGALYGYSPQHTIVPTQKIVLGGLAPAEDAQDIQANTLLRLAQGSLPSTTPTCGNRCATLRVQLRFEAPIFNFFSSRYAGLGLRWFLDVPAPPFGVHRMAFAGKAGKDVGMSFEPSAAVGLSGG